jgi:hypothetical protein
MSRFAAAADANSSRAALISRRINTMQANLGQSGWELISGQAAHNTNQ